MVELSKIISQLTMHSSNAKLMKSNLYISLCNSQSKVINIYDCMNSICVTMIMFYDISGEIRYAYNNVKLVQRMC